MVHSIFFSFQWSSISYMQKPMYKVVQIPLSHNIRCDNTRGICAHPIGKMENPYFRISDHRQANSNEIYKIYQIKTKKKKKKNIEW